MKKPEEYVKAIKFLKSIAGMDIEDAALKLLALLNPVEKEDEDFLSDCCGAEFDAFGFPREDGLYDEKCLKCGKRCDPIWRKIPSPNEAPKGEAKSPCLEYPPYTHHYKVYNGEQTWEVDKCLDCGFPNPNKPQPPDKEWEPKVDEFWFDVVDLVMEFMGNKEMTQAQYNLNVKVITLWKNELIGIIRSLLLSKDQEADRRVEEAYKKGFNDALDKYPKFKKKLLGEKLSSK